MKNSNDPKGGQRIYVWIVSSCTLLLLGLFLWPLSVREFRTTTVFKLKYDPAVGLEKSALNTHVIEALRDQTTRDSLADVFTEMESTMRSSVLNSLEPETIREALNIQGRLGESANSIEYRLSLVGDGSEDEVEFVNAMVARINNHLNRIVSRVHNQEVVKELTNDLQLFHEQTLDQIHDGLSTVVTDLTTIENDLRMAVNDLRDATTTPNQLLARPSNTVLDSLHAEREQLLRQPGMTEFHPQVTAIQRKIEQMAAGTNTSIVQPDPATGVRSQRIVNQYTNASSKKDTDFSMSISEVLRDIELINIDPARESLSDLQQRLQDTEVSKLVVGRLTARAKDDLDSDFPVSMSELSLARKSAPIGGSPTTIQFFGLLFLGGLFGAAVAFNYDPALKKKPFRSIEQLSRKINVPVIGVLRNRSIERPRPLGKLAAARVVQICEWTLLALAVLLILAALANSEVAAAFIENPFHGITRTIWLMSPGT